MILTKNKRIRISRLIRYIECEIRGSSISNFKKELILQANDEILFIIGRIKYKEGR